MQQLPQGSMISKVTLAEPARLPNGSLTGIVLDKKSPVPLYFQIARQIEGAIDRGVYQTGARLDSEVELAERLAVSRPTVRQAIGQLVEQGLVVRRRGVGTVVVPRRIKRPVALSSLFDDLLAVDRNPTTTVLELTTVRANATTAKALDVSVGEPVEFLKRLRWADGAPLGVMTNYLPVGLIDLDATSLEHHGLYALLRAHGVQPQVAEQTIGARGASQAEAHLLKAPRRHIVLTMTRTAFDTAGHSIEYGSHCYRADRYSFEMSLVAR